MPLPDLLLLTFATWRLSYLLTRENAPYNLLGRFRLRYPLGGLMDCPYCMSVWVAVGLYFLFPYMPAVVYVLAISGAAMLLHRYTGGDHI